MKKRLFSILTILGIGVSFCSANNICTNSIDACSYSICTTTCSDVAGFSIKFDIPGEYYIDSFSIKNSQGVDYSSVSSQYPVYFCTFSGFIELSSSSVDYVMNSSDCSIFTGFSVSNSDGNAIFSFDSPYYINSSSTPYFFVYFILGYACINMDYIAGYDWSYSSFNFSLGNNIIYKPPFNKGIYLQPVNVCYSEISGPKFKVNYGNTSFEYELDSDLSIYLKSPAVQSGNIFIYNGSIGLNLFYNNTSQRYNKSNLYLDSMFWYNKNIFTPICL